MYSQIRACNQFVPQSLFHPMGTPWSTPPRMLGNYNGKQLHTYTHTDTTPPKNVLRSGRVTLVEAGFVPAAIIHLGLDSPDDMKTPLLSEKSLQSAQSALQAEIVMSSKWERKR